MYIYRDMTEVLESSAAPAQIILGPRQCGKSTLLSAISKNFHEITFDDLQFRRLANDDPALFLEQFGSSLLLDEIQYVPNLFPEIKKKIDELKRSVLFNAGKVKRKILFRLTGSNQILMDKNVKESLAGRAAYFYLNTLTVHEILKALPKTSLKEILFKGGWPELYINAEISTTAYLNDYIRTYVEKDIMLSAGVQKLTEFHKALILLAARTGQLTDYSSIAKDSGISSVTIKEWTGLLERADLIYFLKPYFSNLNKRLIKTPKIYFLDTGLAARLQGWQEISPMLNSPQIGALFETLVLAEIVKFIRNYNKDWELFFWRTKEGEEVDFVLKTSRKIVAFDAKLSIQNIPQAAVCPPSFCKTFKETIPLTLVTYGGQKLQLSQNCFVVPIGELHDFLKDIR